MKRYKVKYNDNYVTQVGEVATIVGMKPVFSLTGNEANAYICKSYDRAAYVKHIALKMSPNTYLSSIKIEIIEI